MLNLFRKHATSWLIKVALFLIVIVFVFWGGYSYQSRQESQMASVDGHYISIVEYNQAYNQTLDMYKRQMGNAFSEDLLKQLNLKRQVLSILIDRYLVAKAAGLLGLTASIPEIQQKVIEYPVFQVDGKFDQARYQLVLRQNRLTPEAFEQRIASELTSLKVEEFVKRRAIVTEEEIRADFAFNHGMIQLDYVLFDSDSFVNRVAVEGNSLETYYQSHLENYKESEKREFAMVLFKPEMYAGNVTIPESDVKQYYESNGSKYYHPEKVHALHIFIRVAAGSPDAEVKKARQEAEKVLLEVVDGKNFKELAKKYSQDPAAVRNGGDLGFFSRDMMPPEISDAAFALQPGEVSGLVRTSYGFHILKVLEKQPEKTESFEETRAGIEESLRLDRAKDIAYKKAREFADLAYSARDLRKAAETEKLEVFGTGVRVLQTDSLPGMEKTAPETMKKLFALSEQDVSEVMEVPKGYLVVQVKAVQPPGTLPFDKVKDRVEKDFKAHEARNLAQRAAGELLDEAKKSGSLAETGRAKKVEIKKSEWFSRREPFKDLVLRGESQNKLFQLGTAGSFPENPVDLGDRFLVCQLLGRKEPTEKLQEEEREGVQKRLQQEKEAMLWQAWIDEQRRDARIEIYKEL